MTTHRSDLNIPSSPRSSRMITDEQLHHVTESIQTSQPSLIKVVRHLREEAKSRKAIERGGSTLKQDFVDTQKGKEKKAADDGQYTPMKEILIRTLATALSPSKDISGKRKRSITHFEGIPISILSAPSPLTTSSSSLITRKFITKRNIKQLDQCFSRLNFGQHIESVNQKRNYKDESEDESFSATSSMVSSPTSSSSAESESETNSSRNSGSFISTPLEGDIGLTVGYWKGYEENKSSLDQKRSIKPSSNFDISDSESESDDEDDIVFKLAP